MTTKVALYCRVSTSTKDQTTENQLRELTAYCDRMDYEVNKIYEDQISGAKTREKRPAYNQLCKDAFLKRFDLVIAWDVSRFGRSLKEFVSFLGDMDDRGIGVVAVKNGLDTSSSTGKMMMKMIGVMEEWNREMLVERTNSGLAVMSVGYPWNTNIPSNHTNITQYGFGQLGSINPKYSPTQ